MTSPGKNFYVRFKLDVRKPLKNVVSVVHGGKPQLFRIKYERLAYWCLVCGMLGQVYKENVNGVHPQVPTSAVAMEYVVIEVEDKAGGLVVAGAVEVEVHLTSWIL